jgi:DNA-binding SARP family transcriptional activator
MHQDWVIARPRPQENPRLPLYIRALGPVQVELGGTEVNLGPQQRALLTALLLARGRTVSKDQLAELLWPAPAPAGANVTLRSHIFNLRRLLEPERRAPSDFQVLVSSGARQGGGYALRLNQEESDLPQLWKLLADARRLTKQRSLQAARDRLTQALGLWRGPAFANLVNCEFVDAEARRLDEVRLSAQEDLVELDLRLGQHREAIAALTVLLSEHPLREGLWAQLMLALHRDDRRADALAAYQDVYQLLRDELGVAPGARLQQLHQQVLSSDPALDLGASDQVCRRARQRHPRLTRCSRRLTTPYPGNASGVRTQFYPGLPGVLDY